MTNPYEPPEVPARGTLGLRFTRSAAAFLSGALILPILLLVAFRLIFPVEATGYGNAAFWAIVLLGSSLAAVVVLPFQRMPLWLAVAFGPIIVLAILIPWVAWIIIGAA